MIDDRDLERIRAHADLVALVRDTVPDLRQVGQTFRGRCPLCRQGREALAIYADTQTFHCFSCDVTGNVYSWLRRVHHVGFREAVVRVCRRFGLEIPAGADERRRSRS
jgi:DNA primase